MSDVRDVIIIGGGPAGYTAALYTARANLRPLVIEGFNWGGQLMITSDVENYPGYADGVMGPTMMADFRRQAERFGAEFVTDDVTRVDFSERPFRVYVGEDEHRADSVIVATGASARQLGLPVRADAPGPRRVLLRDVRRRVLPRQGRRRRRRRRLGDGGGDVPDPFREQGRDRPPARRVPRLADHGRPSPGEREGRVRPQRRGRRGARRGKRPRHRPEAPRHRHRRDDRDRGGRPVRRGRPRPDHRHSSSTGSTTTRPATSSPSPARRIRTSPASSLPETSRITCTGRP